MKRVVRLLLSLLRIQIPNKNYCLSNWIPACAGMTDKLEKRWCVFPANAYRDVGSRATHDCRDAGGRVTQGAVTEDAKAEAGIQN